MKPSNDRGLCSRAKCLQILFLALILACSDSSDSPNSPSPCSELGEKPPIILWELARTKGNIAVSVAPLEELEQKCADAPNKPASLGLLGDSPQHKAFLVFSGHHPYSFAIPDKENRKLLGPKNCTVLVDSYPDFFQAATAEQALRNSPEEAGFDSRIWFGGGYNTGSDSDNLPHEDSVYHCDRWTQAADAQWGTALTQSETYGYHGGLYEIRDCLPNSIDYILACLSY